VGGSCLSRLQFWPTNLAAIERKIRRGYFHDRRIFDRYEPPKKVISASQHPEALTFDGTFLKRSRGWLVFRAKSKNIGWEQIVNETLV